MTREEAQSQALEIGVMVMEAAYGTSKQKFEVAVNAYLAAMVLPIEEAPRDGTAIILFDGNIVGSGIFRNHFPKGFYFDGASLPCLAQKFTFLPETKKWEINNDPR